MADSQPTFEERVMIIRDKIARENFEVPDEVIDYIAHLYEAPQALKGAVINVAAHAMRRHEPVTLETAQRLLEGIRKPVSSGGPSSAEPSQDNDSSDSEQPSGEDSPFDFVDGDMVDMEAPAAAQGQGVDFIASQDVISPAQSQASHIPAPDYLTAIAGTDVSYADSVETLEPAGTIEPALASDLPDLGHEPEYTEPAELIEVNPIDQSYHDLLGTSEPDDVYVIQEELLLELAEEPPVLLDDGPELTSSFKRDARTCPDGSCVDVYFAPMRTEKKRSMIERAGVALKRAGLESVISPGDYVAVKIHFGERGNTGFVSPIYVREVIHLIKELGGKPFLTDSNTLYSGMRSNAVDHVQCALQNGFSWATVEAPIIIADGLHGHDALDVRIDGKHFESVRIGSAAIEADALVVISHVKGHGEAGFGGAIKNVGMGLGCRSAKQRMHSDVKPRVTFDKCTKCQRCLQWCPVSCITMSEAHDNKAYIHKNQCIGCGECVAACAYGAIAINWETEPAALQEKMVEHAAGVARGKKDKMIFLSFMTNITPECDCWSFSDAPVVPDIGLLASRDMVAIDQAAYDLITDALGNAHSRGEGLAAGQDKFKAMHGIDGSIVMSYGEEFGLGTRNYSLKPIG